MQGRENAVFPRPAGRFETERDALPLLRIPFPAPRRNGLRSIQNPQPNGWGFLIPLRHSSSPQKVTLGSPVRLQWLVKPPRSSRRLAVATNFLRICALRRWRFILSYPYNKKSIVRVSVRCSFLSPPPGNSNPSGSECRPADQQREGDCCTMYEYTQRLRKSVVSRLKDAKCGPQFMCSPA